MRPAHAFGLALAALLSAAIAAGCTKAQETAAAMALTQGCDIALDFLDPSLVPLCTTFSLVGQAVAAVMPADAGAIDAGDAGAVNAALLVVQSATPAQKAAVYAWLVAHGAVPLGG